MGFRRFAEGRRFATARGADGRTDGGVAALRGTAVVQQGGIRRCG